MRGVVRARSRALLLAGALVVLSPALVGCGAAENIVGGVVDEAQGSVDDAIDQARGTVDDAVGDMLGGAGVSTDGELPTGFPSDAVPVTGAVLGGGSGPDSSGWVVRTTLAAPGDFPVAQAALEGAGYASSAVDSDEDSGFGTFTSHAFTVLLTVYTDTDGSTTATYLVTPR